MLTFQLFIVFVVHMSIRIASFAKEAAFVGVSHVLPEFILSIKPLMAETACKTAQLVFIVTILSAQQPYDRKE